MAIITAFCEDAHSLKLGPGLGLQQTPGQLIVFSQGYAIFDEAEFPDWQTWLVGAPHIDILEAGEIGRATADTAEFVCDKCSPPRGFASKKALNGHRLSHRPK
jgi:hypothetical protein